MDVSRIASSQGAKNDEDFTRRVRRQMAGRIQYRIMHVEVSHVLHAIPCHFNCILQAWFSRRQEFMSI